MVMPIDELDPSHSSASDSSASPARISERKLAANRANARRSTGPRTATGKARARHNATRHGLRAALPPEEEPDFQMLRGRRKAYARLRRAFGDDLRPRGAAEQFLVERMARAAWRLRLADAVEVELLESAEEAELRSRVFRAEFALERGEIDADEHAAAGRQRGVAEAVAGQFSPTRETPLRRLATYQARLEGTFRAALRELRLLRKGDHPDVDPDADADTELTSADGHGEACPTTSPENAPAPTPAPAADIAEAVVSVTPAATNEPTDAGASGVVQPAAGPAVRPEETPTPEVRPACAVTTLSSASNDADIETDSIRMTERQAPTRPTGSES